MPDDILAGLRVVDMTTGIAGPVATQLLAEYGADVVKVEPLGGDRFRDTPLFRTTNRSKRGMTVDLRTAPGRTTLDGLLAGADVLVHRLRPARARELGLDDAALAQRYPQLVVSAVLGYPAAHPDAERPGYDILVQARSGVMDEQGGRRPGPVFLRFPLPSWAAVHLVTAGVLARLLARERSGRGGAAHTSLYQGVLAAMVLVWNRAESPTPGLADKIPLTKGTPGMARCLFECADGEWMQIATLTGYTEHPLVIETMLEAGHDFSTVEGWAPTDEQLAVYQDVFRRRPRAEWLRELAAGDVPVAPIEPLGSVFTDPQAVVNGYVVEVEDPVHGPVRQPGAPFRVEPPARVRGPAPALGEHDGTVPWPSRSSVAGSAPAARRPLEGLKVLDTGMYVAGPLGPRLLADLGADVVKIEPVVGGDRVRVFEAQYVGVNRGKRSVALDLGDPRSRPVLEELIRWADVVHHNLRMPAAAKLGLDWPAVHACNPRAVLCHVSAYGSVGEKANWPGYDPTASAASGWALESGGRAGAPMWYRFGIWDVQAAMSSVLPTLMAVLRRGDAGEGSFVSVSMLGIAALTNSETMLAASGELAPFPRVDDGQTGVGPGYRIYRTADDEWIAVAAVAPAQLTALREVAGVDADEQLPGALRGRTAEALLKELDAAGVPAEQVRRDDEQRFFDTEGGPGGLATRSRHPVYGVVEQPGRLWDFGDLELCVDVPPPTLGQHTAQVLAELGLDGAAIEDLAAAGVIGLGPDGHQA